MSAERPFQIHDIVRYSTTGVCEIEDITVMKFGKKETSYYVLQPVYKDALQVYVPCDNTELLSKMRRILSAEEIMQLLHSLPKENCDWIENDIKRKEIYQDVLSGGDRSKLIGMIRAIYLHQQVLLKSGKKLHQSDERFFREAQKLLNDEFAYVLQLQPEQVTAFIIAQMGEN